MTKRSAVPTQDSGEKRHDAGYKGRKIVIAEAMKAMSPVHVPLLLVLGCGAAGGVPGMPGGGGESSTNPNACGDIAKVDIGRRVHAFLDASATLEKRVTGIEAGVKATCVTMGKKLAMSGAALEGTTKAVCASVAQELRASLRAGLKGSARLRLDYKPAVCTVDADIAASASAKCEAKASADVAVSCSGTCEGSCNGTCNGTCAGSTGSGGSCNGECKGTCNGQCSGSCKGSAKVQGEATCKASAEVKANAQVNCTKPKVDVSYDVALVADTARLERAVAAVKAGIPTMLLAKAQLTGPLKGALRIWARTARQLAAGARGKLKALGGKALCVSGQLAAAAKATANVQASFSVSVQASASVGGSAGI